MTEKLEGSKPVGELLVIRVPFQIIAITFGVCIRLVVYLLGLACITQALHPSRVLVTSPSELTAAMLLVFLLFVVVSTWNLRTWPPSRNPLVLEPRAASLSRDSRYFRERMLPDIVICWGVPGLVFGSTWWFATAHVNNPSICIWLALLATLVFTWWIPGRWLSRSRKAWIDKRKRIAQVKPKRPSMRLHAPAWPRRMVRWIPIRMRMRLALAIGLASLATGIGIWWPMVAAGEFSDTAVKIPSYYLASLAANFLGIALLQHWLVQRSESRKQAEGEIESEPSEPCSHCKHGHLIPVSVALLPFLSSLGYLLIGLGLWLSAEFAPFFFGPFGTGSIFSDPRNNEIYSLAVMLLVGWLLRLRTRILICDHCWQRSYPRPRGLDRHPEPADNDQQWFDLCFRPDQRQDSHAHES